ncbi:MAG: serine hydrolase [Candidatus Shapirobacteria bacterium]|jgi:beta-lactamase class A
MKTFIRRHYPKAIMIIVSFAVGYIISPPGNSLVKEIRLKGSYQYTNPLLECDSVNLSNATNLNHLRDQIKNAISTETKTGNISYASVYFRDLNNGPWFGINEKDDFSPASLIKVPLMIAYYKQAETDPTILEQKITNTQVDDASNSQNIIPEVTLTPNRSYSVDELIDIMITYSDNLAYELLLKNIDGRFVFQVYNDMSIDIQTKQSGNPAGNILSVKDYASFFRVLYNSSYLNKNMSEKALKLLTQSNFNLGIVGGTPTNIEVSHKFGERQFLDIEEKQLHDCGIVHLPQKQYLLCIMTRGQDFTKLASFIKQTSATIFSEINQEN